MSYFDNFFVVFKRMSTVVGVTGEDAIAHCDDTAPDVLNRVRISLGDPTTTAILAGKQGLGQQ